MGIFLSLQYNIYPFERYYVYIGVNYSIPLSLFHTSARVNGITPWVQGYKKFTFQRIKLSFR